MEYEVLRQLLADGLAELDDLFARGLDRGDRQTAALAETAAAFARAGLAGGAEAWTRLAEALAGARVDADWTATAAALCFARCRDYLRVCLERLDYLEAAVRLRDDTGKNKGTALKDYLNIQARSNVGACPQLRLAAFVQMLSAEGA
jgi:hypothetical protein